MRPVLLGLIPLLGIPIALLIAHVSPLYPDQDSALTEILRWMRGRFSSQ